MGKVDSASAVRELKTRAEKAERLQKDIETLKRAIDQSLISHTTAHFSEYSTGKELIPNDLLVYDDSSQVQRVHLGIVYSVECRYRPALIENHDYSFVTPTILHGHSRLEAWSRIVLDHLVANPGVLFG